MRHVLDRTNKGQSGLSGELMPRVQKGKKKVMVQRQRVVVSLDEGLRPMYLLVPPSLHVRMPLPFYRYLYFFSYLLVAFYALIQTSQ